MGEPRRHRRESGWTWRWWRGSVLVMGPDRTPHRLEGAAAATWAALEHPAVVDALAPAGDAAALDAVRTATAALVELGAVVEVAVP